MTSAGDLLEILQEVRTCQEVRAGGHVSVKHSTEPAVRRSTLDTFYCRLPVLAATDYPSDLGTVGNLLISAPHKAHEVPHIPSSTVHPHTARIERLPALIFPSRVCMIPHTIDKIKKIYK